MILKKKIIEDLNEKITKIEKEAMRQKRIESYKREILQRRLTDHSALEEYIAKQKG
jgi:hypothetical protein